MSAENIECGLLADRSLGLTKGLPGLRATMFEAVVRVAGENSLLDPFRRLVMRPTRGGLCANDEGDTVT